MVGVLSASAISIVASAELTKQQQQINDYIDQLPEQHYDKDLIKAIGWVESNFTQFNKNGTTFTDGSLNRLTGKVSHDFGVFQLNEVTLRKAGFTEKQIKRCKTDANFNINVGISILEGKGIYIKNLQKKKHRWHKIVKKNALKGMSELDMVILAYNGIQKDKIYLKLVRKALAEKPWQDQKQPVLAVVLSK